jgi:hypothetical protein
MGAAYSNQMDDLASRIEVSDGTATWRPVPSWLAFFFSLGTRAAIAQQSGRRVSVVVVPPVRCFAAAAAAASAVTAVARAAEALPGVEEHFNALTQLPLGTSVVVKMGERIYAAKFAGVVDQGKGSFIHVEYGGMTHYIPKQLCQRIQVGKGGRRTLPKVSLRPRQSDADVIAAIVGPTVSADFLSVPTVDVVLIGHVALLSEELTSLLVRPASLQANGYLALSGLLRSASFLPEGGISRSMLVSDRVAEFEMPVSDTPHVVVFDGARAFTRYRSEFTRSSWIVILDRCSPGLIEGADVANGEFARRTGDADFMDMMIAPSGTEVQVFERH